MWRQRRRSGRVRDDAVTIAYLNPACSSENWSLPVTALDGDERQAFPPAGHHTALGTERCQLIRSDEVAGLADDPAQVRGAEAARPG
jgi:hypothetical protein